MNQMVVNCVELIILNRLIDYDPEFNNFSFELKEFELTYRFFKN